MSDDKESNDTASVRLNPPAHAQLDHLSAHALKHQPEAESHHLQAPGGMPAAKGLRDVLDFSLSLYLDTTCTATAHLIKPGHGS